MPENQETKLASLVQTRKTIANKFRKLHNDRIDQERVLRSKYAPITDKLDTLIDAKEDILKEMKNFKFDNDEADSVIDNFNEDNVENVSVNRKNSSGNVVKYFPSRKKVFTRKNKDEQEEPMMVDEPEIELKKTSKIPMWKIFKKNRSNKKKHDDDEPMEIDMPRKKPIIKKCKRVNHRRVMRSRAPEVEFSGKRRRECEDIDEQPFTKKKMLNCNKIDLDSSSKSKKCKKESDIHLIDPMHVKKEKSDLNPVLIEKKNSLKRIRDDDIIEIQALNKKKRFDVRKRQQKEKNLRSLHSIRETGLFSYNEKIKKDSEAKAKKKAQQNYKVISPEDFSADGKRKKGHLSEKRRKIEIKIKNRRAAKKKKIPADILESRKRKKFQNNRKSVVLKYGQALEKGFIPYTENIAYEYYDDPNELCERLQLLIASKGAGNTNHDQEINSIIEELRESNIIE